MASLLQAAQQHDLDKAPDMERGCGGIKSDIARHNLFYRKVIKTLRIGHLVDIATARKQGQKFGFIMCHSVRALSTAAGGKEG